MTLIPFFIIFLTALISAFFISFKVHRALSLRVNIFAEFFSLLAFIVSLIGIGIMILFMWDLLTGGFSRR